LRQIGFLVRDGLTGLRVNLLGPFGDVHVTGVAFERSFIAVNEILALIVDRGLADQLFSCLFLVLRC
jgi:hypothetical protein